MKYNLRYDWYLRLILINKQLNDEGNSWRSHFHFFFFLSSLFACLGRILSTGSESLIADGMNWFYNAKCPNGRNLDGVCRWLGVYVARDGPSISLKKISRLSVSNGNGILFPRTGGSFRQLADRYLADWVDSTRRGSLRDRAYRLRNWSRIYQRLTRKRDVSLSLSLSLSVFLSVRSKVNRSILTHKRHTWRSHSG